MYVTPVCVYPLARWWQKVKDFWYVTPVGTYVTPIAAWWVRQEVKDTLDKKVVLTLMAE